MAFDVFHPYQTVSFTIGGVEKAISGNMHTYRAWASVCYGPVHTLVLIKDALNIIILIKEEISSKKKTKKKKKKSKKAESIEPNKHEEIGHNEVEDSIEVNDLESGMYLGV